MGGRQELGEGVVARRSGPWAARRRGENWDATFDINVEGLFLVAEIAPKTAADLAASTVCAFAYRTGDDGRAETQPRRRIDAAARAWPGRS